MTVPELTKTPSTQSPAIPSSVSPSPGPISSTTSSTATPAAGAPPQGGNNAKRSAVANGQPSPSTQVPQRYMPREVPPRFRCQQDHKVLLKRGQPPLSSMLLGGGNSGGDSPNATVAAASGNYLQFSSGLRNKSIYFRNCICCKRLLLLEYTLITPPTSHT